MNERIRELADQAWNDTRKKFGSFVDDGGEMDYTFLDAYDQKLAELIVRKCCDIFVELRTRPADLAVKDVKKHFGVEE
jgi:hypothetical protein